MPKYKTLFDFIRLASIVLILANCLILPSPVQAQTPLLRFYSLTTLDGLSHDIVYAITQDQQGFLWFGTQDGLNRYDGYNFTIFRHLRSNPDSLVHNTVYALNVDSAGNLWVGTVGGLDRFEHNTAHFIHYSEITESVTVIFEDRGGTLWIGTAGSGLFYYDRRADRFIPYHADELNDKHILAIYRDQDNTLWVGTEYGGLHAFYPGETVPRLYRHDSTNIHSLPYDRVTAITQDHHGTLWVGTGANYEPAIGGLASLDEAGGGRPTLSNSFTLHKRGLDHNHITAILADQTANLWIGTENGLAILAQKGNTTTRSPSFIVYHHNPLDPYSLSNDRIRALYEDRSGIIWIATDNGISRYARARDRFALYRHDPLDPNSLGTTSIGAILKDQQGVLWIGLHNGGLDRLDRATGKITHYRHDPTDATTLSHDHVTALHEDQTGAIWVGTELGLDRLDLISGHFTHYIHRPTDSNSIGPGAVKVIVEDHSHSLWIGTEEPGTLSRLDPSTGVFTVYRYDPANPSSFPNTYGVRAIIEDKAGDLWIGTYNGLIHFDPHSNTFTQYKRNPADPASLSDDFIWSIYEDQNGSLWVGTHGGLNLLDKTSGKFKVYTIEDGLPNDGIAAILGDEAGYLWLATMGGGLSRFDPHTGTFRNYDLGDGLQGLHFIIGAAYQSPDGELFFGGTNGFNSFYPSDIQNNPYIPPVVLTTFRKFDQVVDFGSDLASLNEITLPYQDNFFAFEFAALDYTDPAKNQYAYKLEGFDRDWVYCGRRHYAAYTNIPPGTYTFRVKGSNNDGVWNEEGLAVRLVITPSFWQTWWFRTLVTLTVLGIAAAFIGVRMRYVATLRRSEERFRTLFESAPLGICEVDLTQSPPRILHANRDFERIFGQRGETLTKATLQELFLPESWPILERLHQSLSTAKPVALEATGLRGDGSPFPARLCAAIGPERNLERCILTFEDLTAEKERRSEEEAITKERQRIAREIHDGLAQDLAALRLQVRRWQALLESDPGQVRVELEGLHYFLGKEIREVRRAIFALRPIALDELGFWPALRRFLTEFGEQNQLHVSLQVSGAEDRLPAHLEPVLFRIVQEALNNIAKHAQANAAWINLDTSEGIMLEVRDNGVGFNPSELEQLAQRGHLGLKQMRERVVGLKGTFSLHSKPGQGTQIRVVLPMT